MKFDCPHCQQTIEADDAFAGQPANCPTCKQALVLPQLSAETPGRVAVAPQTEAARRAAQPRACSAPDTTGSGGRSGRRFFGLLLLIAMAGSAYYFRAEWAPMAREWTSGRAPGEISSVPPAPAPPTPVPVATPMAAAATPAPAAVVETPRPDADVLAWLLEHKEHAPKEVTLQRPAALSISANGAVIDSVTVPAGGKVRMVAFTSQLAAVRFVNASGQIPIDATDLRALAKAEQEKAEQEKAGPAGAFALPSPPAPVSRAVAFPKPRFTSPGVILNREDLETLKANIKREPWKSGFEALAADGHSKLGYRMAGPFKEIKRAPHVNLWPWRNDMTAIWNLSRMWYFTGDTAYAQKAHDILLAWATTHTEFGGRESMLDLGDYAAAFVGGADILRGTWPGWTAADTAAVKKYFNDVLIPASNPFGESQFGAANKGALALCAKGLMAIFNEDTATLRTVVYQIRTLPHIGLRSSNDIGMLGDSLRDQGHAHGQLVSLAMLAEALWKQGIDIYSDYDNRLLAAGEYFARVNTLTPTPFLPFGTTDAYYLADNTNRGWGGGSVALNLIHGAYVVRKGLPAPYADRKRQTMPVDGGSFMFIKEVDHSVATPMVLPPIPATTAITSGFANAEIGGASPSGGASYSGGTWKVQGGGSDIWRTSDSCHFTYKAITGNCAIIAKVESVQNTSPSARAGVMMRASLSQGAPRAWMALTGGGNLEQNMPNLAVYGGTNYSNKALAKSLSSYWVKLERIGNIISGSVSPDGTNWAATDVGRIEAPVPDTIYVGLVVCPGANGTLNTATFSGVQITDGEGAPTVVTPAAPSALLAAPGRNAVSLRWQPSFGAASYTVKRANTSGGPYATVALDITASSYTDTTVTDGTTYYYVVSGVNSAGAGPNSPEDAATPRGPMWNVSFGGTATATVGAESASRAFDSNSNTLWLASRCGGVGAIQYDFGAGRAPLIKGYTVTSPNLKPERNPRDWQFQGSNDGTSWTTLDTQDGQTFPLGFYEVEYALAKPAAYRHFRLNITANNGDNDLQVADLKLLSDAPLPNAPLPSLIHWKTNDATDRDRALAGQQAAESKK